jgi:cell division control protein 6
LGLDNATSDRDVILERLQHLEEKKKDLISDLDFFGLINAVVVNRGKYGRAKEISLSVPEEFVQTLLFEDHKLKALSDIWVKVEETS